MDKISGLVANRLVRNITFWILIGTTVSYSGYYIFGGLTPILFLVFFFIHFSTFAPLIYVNNLLLIPHIFMRRQVGVYFLGATVSVVISSLWMQQVHTTVVSRWPFLAPNNDYLELPFVTAVFTNTLIIVAFTMVLFGTNWLVNRRKYENLNRTNIQNELQGLKAQINPHFLFNTLNTIYGLARKKDENTPEAVMRLSDILRYVLYECNTSTVPLEKECKYLKNYIDFVKMRYSDDTKIHFVTEGDCSNRVIAPLLLLPFVENSIKHGLDKHLENPWLSASLKVTEDNITFTCSNIHGPSKKGTDPGGIGRQNVKKRLDLLYPGKYTLTEREESDNYFVSLIIEDV